MGELIDINVVACRLEMRARSVCGFAVVACLCCSSYLFLRLRPLRSGTATGAAASSRYNCSTHFEDPSWIRSRDLLLQASTAGPPYNCSLTQVPEPHPSAWGRPRNANSSCVEDLQWTHGSWQGLGSSSARWTPQSHQSTCQFTHFDQPAVCALAARLEIKHFKFLGDSIMRAMFWAFAGMVLDPSDAQSFGDQCFWKVILGNFDKVCRNASYEIKLCNGTVEASYEAWTYVSRNPLERLQQQTDRMLVVASVGFHNMYRGDDQDYAGSIEKLNGCPGVLTSALRASLGGWAASDAVQVGGSRLVWVAYHPRNLAVVYQWHRAFGSCRLNETECEYLCQYMLQRNSAFARLNQVAQQVISAENLSPAVQLFSPWNLVADVYDVHTANTSDWGGDGAEYRKDNSHGLHPATWDGTHYSWWVVQAKVNALLNYWDRSYSTIIE